MRSSTIVRAGFLALSVATLTPPSLAQTGAPADSSNPATGRDFPAYLAPGALVPPDLAPGSVVSPYIAPGTFIPLPDDTTGSSIHQFGPTGMDTPNETPNPSRKSLIDDE